MRIAILALTAGILALQSCPELPETPVFWGLGAFGVLMAWLSHRAGPAAGMAALAGAAALSGFAWAGLAAAWRLGDELPRDLEGQDVQVVGVVAGLPQQFENGLRFDFDVERAAAKVPTKVSLAWYQERPREEQGRPASPGLAAGERWRLTVRLKRPHGQVNPHGFDQEAWMFERGLRATGYVRRSDDNARLDSLAMRPGYLVERLRQRVRDRIERVLADAPYAAVLVALAIGDQRGIAPELWRVFRRTGVTHLLSVSGLHVTMVAGLAAAVVGWVWRRQPRLPLRLPVQKAAAAAGLLAALAYCLLAGFAVPAQRTLYMLAVVGLALWTGRTTAPSRVLALALLVVLLADPWAVLSAGFWLSFGAVALLFQAGSGRIGRSRLLAAWFRSQWAVTIGLVPALLALFQQFSLVSPLANAVAIPLVSLLVTPLVLAGMLPLMDPLLWLAHGLTAALMICLRWLALSSWAVWQQPAPALWSVILGVAGVAWLLLPRGFPGRWPGLVLLLPAVLTAPARPQQGELVATVLDVGQGLAVHVQTAQHDLLYDAGPAFSGDANSGDRILVPYLRAKGVAHLDTLIVSHEDKDHEGGAAAVLAAVPVNLLQSSVADDHPLAAQPVNRRRCLDGDNWEWDGVDFRVLHPPPEAYGGVRRSNDLSCVLRIQGAFGSLLLAGDIDSRQEAGLVARHGAALAVDALVPPHHGSRGASSSAFVAAVRPRQVLFSAGYRNRFGHPATDIQDRYRAIDAHLHRTDLDGALTLAAGVAGPVVLAERRRQRRYWHGR